MARTNILGKRIWAMRQKDPTLSAYDIAKKMGCSKSYVSKVIYTDKWKYQTQNSPAPATNMVDDMLLAKEKVDEQLVGMVRLKEVIAESDHINRLNKEITELKAVVRYLEGKVGGLRGAPV